jgi:hypothetical protein
MRYVGLLVFFLLFAQPAFASMPIHDPYSEAYYPAHGYAWGCSLIKDPVQQASVCQVDGLGNYRVPAPVIRQLMQITNEGDISACDGIPALFPEYADVIIHASGEETRFVDMFVEDCKRHLEFNRSIVYPAPEIMKKIDGILLFLSTIAGALYLYYILKAQNITGWKQWALPIIVQIILVFIVVLVREITWLQTGGPLLPTVYDLLFFRSEYYMFLITATLLSMLLLYVGAWIFLKRYNARQRDIFAYVLIAHPFFFPFSLLWFFTRAK